VTRLASRFESAQGEVDALTVRFRSTERLVCEGKPSPGIYIAWREHSLHRDREATMEMLRYRR